MVMDSQTQTIIFSVCASLLVVCLTNWFHLGFRQTPQGSSMNSTQTKLQMNSHRGSETPFYPLNVTDADRNQKLVRALIKDLDMGTSFDPLTEQDYDHKVESWIKLCAVKGYHENILRLALLNLSGERMRDKILSSPAVHTFQLRPFVDIVARELFPNSRQLETLLYELRNATKTHKTVATADQYFVATVERLNMLSHRWSHPLDFSILEESRIYVNLLPRDVAAQLMYTDNWRRMDRRTLFLRASEIYDAIDRSKPMTPFTSEVSVMDDTSKPEINATIAPPTGKYGRRPQYSDVNPSEPAPPRACGHCQKLKRTHNVWHWNKECPHKKICPSCGTYCYRETCESFESDKKNAGGMKNHFKAIIKVDASGKHILEFMDTANKEQILADLSEKFSEEAARAKRVREQNAAQAAIRKTQNKPQSRTTKGPIEEGEIAEEN